MKTLSIGKFLAEELEIYKIHCITGGASSSSSGSASTTVHNDSDGQTNITTHSDPQCDNTWVETDSTCDDAPEPC